jgi:N-acetyl-anhydromuramyl-L-alanine amidase AmpD
MKTFLSFLTIFLMFNTAYCFEFKSHYQNKSFLPNGLLEAVSYTNTHMREIKSDELPSCTGMPLPFGIMGLFENGNGYFTENGKKVAKLSGLSLESQKSSVSNQIEAYAAAFNFLMKEKTNSSTSLSKDPVYILKTLKELSELPELGIVNQFARDAFVYQVLSYMNDVDFAANYNFQPYSFDLRIVFGNENYKVLSSKRVSLTTQGIFGGQASYMPHIDQIKSTEYGPAIWNPAASCNFSSRAGTAISAITIHTVQGTYSGCISWFQNCNASVSAHYVIRSSDGQVTQMVLEADKAWHVGSENPYTIGYEHEGYVADASWYTNNMYSSSADLSRDITTSGYGISPLRTFFGDATTTVNVLGGCTKIKGHQHYSNQTHTDPGINWNWEKYYKLINNNPTITNVTTTTGNLYDSGGQSANYSDDERKLWLIQPANASTITVNFTSFNIENNWDYLFIYNGSTTDAPLIGKYTGTNSPGNITSTGGSLLIEFRSDCATTAAGWEATFTSTIVTIDNAPPTTTIASGPTWRTANFSNQITDSDGQSGINKGFYQVTDKAPSTSSWHANGSFGFVNEDFQEANSYWTLQTGLYSVSGGAFVMNDNTQNNSNAYLNVTQNSSSEYLYMWEQKILTSLTNQRAGMHFFCSDPTLPNRGESYFIYFRDQDDIVQFYRVTNDVFAIVHEVPFTITPNVNYEVKTWYNPNTGKIKVYVNNTFLGEWTDPNPLLTGNSISLRTGGCGAQFDNVRVYKSRSNNVSISVGTNQEMRFQSDNAVQSGKISSLAIDNNENWSNESTNLYLIDWTAPIFAFVNDGTGNDIDTSYSTTLKSNWSASDIHSSLASYQWALGTTSGGTNVVNWTSASLNTAVQQVLTNPVYGQIYYFSVKSTNGAGLVSTSSSDGQKLLQQTSGVEDLLANVVFYPNPAKNYLSIKGVNSPISITIIDNSGKICGNHRINSDTQFPLNLADGIYSLLISSDNSFKIERIVISN